MSAHHPQEAPAIDVTRGFVGRRRAGNGLIPPGQDLTDGFPVLTAGPTPSVDLAPWAFTVVGSDGQVRRRWTWEEFHGLPSEHVVADIHCVTGWSKVGTVWRGVSVDTLLSGVDDDGEFVVVHADPDFTTNVPLADIVDGKAWVVYEFDGAPLVAEHGGPARFLLPHLYFWKSAKWVSAIRLSTTDEPGFWERIGYHNYGDPWRQQRHR